jgi:hypothetical protein
VRVLNLRVTSFTPYMYNLLFILFHTNPNPNPNPNPDPKAFFGFSVRWHGPPKDESRFIHPMFIGSMLAKKPLSLQAKKIQEDLRAKNIGVNPYRYDPQAASLGRCPVCAIGSEGCPYCFMLPLNTSTGTRVG